MPDCCHIGASLSASQMFASRGILSFDELLHKSIYRFVERIENSTNSILGQIQGGVAEGQPRFDKGGVAIICLPFTR